MFLEARKRVSLSMSCRFFFRKLCDSCMSARALSPLRSKLFPIASPNPNECMHERSESAHAHTRVAEIKKKKLAAYI